MDSSELFNLSDWIVSDKLSPSPEELALQAEEQQLEQTQGMQEFLLAQGAIQNYNPEVQSLPPLETPALTRSSSSSSYLHSLAEAECFNFSLQGANLSVNNNNFQFESNSSSQPHENLLTGQAFEPSTCLWTVDSLSGDNIPRPNEAANCTELANSLNVGYTGEIDYTPIEEFIRQHLEPAHCATAPEDGHEAGPVRRQPAKTWSGPYITPPSSPTKRRKATPGNGSIKCRRCDSTFTTGQSLRTHERIHDNVMEVCGARLIEDGVETVCTHATSDKSNMRKHKQGHGQFGRRQPLVCQHNGCKHETKNRRTDNHTRHEQKCEFRPCKHCGQQAPQGQKINQHEQECSFRH